MHSVGYFPESSLLFNGHQPRFPVSVDYLTLDCVCFLFWLCFSFMCLILNEIASSSNLDFSSGFHLYMSLWSDDLPSSRPQVIVTTTVRSVLVFFHTISGCGLYSAGIHASASVTLLPTDQCWHRYVRGGGRFSQCSHKVRPAKRKYLWIIYRHYIL